jgi:rhodanese-related sulfurtransferase
LDNLELEAWELASHLSSPDIILDLRTVDQFARAHLRGSINLTYNDFQGEAEQRTKGLASVLLVDEAGARAAEMAVWLRARGIPARYLVGGISAWRGALERG